MTGDQARSRDHEANRRAGKAVGLGILAAVACGVLWVLGFFHNPVLEEQMHDAALVALPIALPLWGVTALRVRRMLRARSMRLHGCTGWMMGLWGAMMGFALLLMGAMGLLLLINGVFAGGAEVHRVQVLEKDSYTGSHSSSGSSSSTSRTYTVHYVEVPDWTGARERRRLADNTDFFTLELWNAVEPGDELAVRTRTGCFGWTTIVAVDGTAR